MGIRRRSLLPALWLALFGASAADAASFQLSDGQGSSFPFGQRISPDGRWLVWVEDAETPQAYELWRVPVQGGTPSRLSGLLIVGEQIQDFAISPDSAWVAYTAREDDIDHLEVYAAPLAGPPGSAVKLNDPLATGGDVYDVEFAPDSTRLLFNVNYADDGTRELWTATPDGADLDLVASVPVDHSILRWQFTPDSQFVLYTGRPATITDLWRAPIAGGASVRLSTDLPANRGVTEFAVSPDGSLAVYTANRDAANRRELFRVPVAGGTPQQISEELGIDLLCSRIGFSPDGQRVIYVQASTGAAELWSVEPDGDGRVKLNGLFTPGGSLDPGNPYRISPDSSRVVYLADQQVFGRRELYGVPIAGGADVKINTTPVAGGSVGRYAISADSARVVYLADIEQDDRVDLYSSSLQSGPSLRLSQAPLLSTVDVVDFALSVDGLRAFYVLDALPIFGEATSHLYAVPVSGGALRLVDGASSDGTEFVLQGLVASPVDPRVAVFQIGFTEPSDHSTLFYGDVCLFCNGFEGSWRWDSAPPP